MHYDAAANADCGLHQYYDGAAGRFAVEVTADLTSGTWDGAGIVLQWFNATGETYTYKGGAEVSFLTDKDTANYAGNNGFRRT